MRILTIIGARPQFVKASVVSNALARHHSLSETIVHTGQHYDDNMSHIFFEELGIPRPAMNLNIGCGLHGSQTGRMLIALEQAMLDIKPDMVIIYGDTNSTLAGAICASKILIPVAHIEAGLRSFDRSMPEEINRIIADTTSDLLFAPTKIAQSNLLNEGIDINKIKMVGDVMYDASIYYRDIAARQSNILERLGIEPQKYALATVHRASTTDDRQLLHNVFFGLAKVSEELPVILPLHPRTRKFIESTNTFQATTLKIINPVGYFDMLQLEANASVIATDSGGVQKEAFFFRVPCVTLRDTSEWVELFELGWNVLISPASGSDAICSTILDRVGRYGAEGTPYGAGDASEKIASFLAALQP